MTHYIYSFLKITTLFVLGLYFLFVSTLAVGRLAFNASIDTQVNVFIGLATLYLALFAVLVRRSMRRVHHGQQFPFHTEIADSFGHEQWINTESQRYVYARDFITTYKRTRTNYPEHMSFTDRAALVRETLFLDYPQYRQALNTLRIGSRNPRTVCDMYARVKGGVIRTLPFTHGVIAPYTTELAQEDGASAISYVHDTVLEDALHRFGIETTTSTPMYKESLTNVPYWVKFLAGTHAQHPQMTTYMHSTEDKSLTAYPITRWQKVAATALFAVAHHIRVNDFSSADAIRVIETATKDVNFIVGESVLDATAIFNWAKAELLDANDVHFTDTPTVARSKVLTSGIWTWDKEVETAGK